MNWSKDRDAEIQKLKAELTEAQGYIEGQDKEIIRLKAEVETLREHKRLLFEENGRLLAEKEAGLWDANHPIRIDLEREREANAKLREALVEIRDLSIHDSVTDAYDIAKKAMLAAKQDEGNE